MFGARIQKVFNNTYSFAAFRVWVSNENRLPAIDILQCIPIETEYQGFFKLLGYWDWILLIELWRYVLYCIPNIVAQMNIIKLVRVTTLCLTCDLCSRLVQNFNSLLWLLQGLVFWLSLVQSVTSVLIHHSYHRVIWDYMWIANRNSSTIQHTVSSLARRFYNSTKEINTRLLNVTFFSIPEKY